MAAKTRGDTGRTRRRDRLLRALSVRRRRAVLRALPEGGELDVTELAARVTARDPTAQGGAAEAVATDLYHAHVPALADVGLVTLDSEANAVALTDAGADVESSLDALDALVARDTQGR